jgi:1-acyl-sn-glycerol-3-phosphate acyltransferase
VNGIGSRAFYRTLRAIVLPIARVVFRIRFTGLDRVPSAGPYVLAPSHRSLLDVPFAGFVAKRRVRFMAKKELFEKRFPAWFFTALGGFAVERGATDRAALRAAEAILEGGEPLALFPEGTRNRGSELGPLFHGAAFLAARCQVPIVPVGIGGSEQILPSGTRRPRIRRVAIVVGQPIAPPAHDGRVRRREVNELTDALRLELQAAFTESLGQVS